MKTLSFIQRLILVVIAGLLGIIGGRYSKNIGDHNPQIKPLPQSGWETWGGVTVAFLDSAIIVNGTVNSAGCFTLHVDTAMKNKTVVLKIENAAASKFSGAGPMIKITVNANDTLVRPLNINSLIYGEYVPAWHDTIEFVFPSDFDGKLGFVFTQAELNNLRITAHRK